MHPTALGSPFASLCREWMTRTVLFTAYSAIHASQKLVAAGGRLCPHCSAPCSYRLCDLRIAQFLRKACASHVTQSI